MIFPAWQFEFGILVGMKLNYKYGVLVQSPSLIAVRRGHLGEQERRCVYEYCCLSCCPAGGGGRRFGRTKP